MPAFLLGVSSEEVRALNQQFGGTTEMNSTVDAVFQSASYATNFWKKVAIVVRSIAGGHLLDNGNKRTAFRCVKLFKLRNQVVTGTNDTMLRETIRLVAIHLIKDVDQIASQLRGF